MRPPKRPRDRSEYDERPNSRHIIAKSQQSCFPRRHDEGLIARGSSPDPRYVTRHWNHDDSRRQDLGSRSWGIRNSLEDVEPKFPPGFEPSTVGIPSPSFKNVLGTAPKIDHVEEGEIISSSVRRQIRSAVFACMQQGDYEDDVDDDEIPPLRVREEFITNGIGGAQVETTKCHSKGDDSETPLVRVTEGVLTKDVQGAEFQVEITNSEDFIIKVEGDDKKNIPPATHEVLPPIDDNHMAVNTIIPQVLNKGTHHHEVRENLSEDEVLVNNANANAISTPSSDVFNPMGSADTVKEIMEVWRQYTCARRRHEEVQREEEKHVQKLDHLMSLLVKDRMNAEENE